MHIHPGTCTDQSQPPSVPFPDLVADASGVVKQSVVSAAVPDGIPTGAYLNIHLAPMAELGAPTDVSFTPIACADIPAGTPTAGPVTLNAQAPARQDRTPQGTATLTYDSTQHTLGVEVKATGLQPDSGHAVHVHSGSCAAQGDVVYPVPDLQADGAGEATTTTTIDNVGTPPPATGWYVNVHMGPMSQILNGSTPTLLFAPILCGDVTE
ncbi:CHRD domain-containing protein [Rhodococcus sp. NPDC059968]|uniref:CHRD domain-containing protein n=1 Tax=Rhodococcus sp. NPDC059968 TaxID=3347017 RepID=UPI003671CCFE